MYIHIIGVNHRKAKWKYILTATDRRYRKIDVDLVMLNDELYVWSKKLNNTSEVPKRYLITQTYAFIICMYIHLSQDTSTQVCRRSSYVYIRHC